jgi:predicted GTPase
VLGGTYRDKLTAMSSLAVIKQSQSDLKTAEELGRKVLESMVGTLGDEDVLTVTARSDLADTLWKRGWSEGRWEERWAEAIKLKKEAISVSRRVLGDSHPSTMERRAKFQEWESILFGKTELTVR